MHMPLDVALGIGQAIDDARLSRVPLDIAVNAETLFLRFADCGYSRVQLAEILQEEAAAAGLTLH